MNLINSLTQWSARDFIILISHPEVFKPKLSLLHGAVLFPLIILAANF